MVAAVRAGDVADVTAALEAAGETVFQVGEIGEGARGCTVKGSQGTWSAKADWSATHEG
jgi:phosphoribosylformylglycinamidine cyclo-ligase